VTAYRPGPDGQNPSANDMDRSVTDLTFPAEWVENADRVLALA
jgi:hypothetical protein